MLVDQLGKDGQEAELENVVVVRAVRVCLYVFGLRVEEEVDEREEWRFRSARAVEELQV